MMQNRIKHYLANLNEKNQLLDSLLIATKSGHLLVFSNLSRAGPDKTRLGYMSVSLTGLIVNLIKSYKKREFVAFTIETKQRIVSSSLIKFPRGDALLVCVCSSEVQMGLALRNFQLHKQKLEAILFTDQ